MAIKVVMPRVSQTMIEGILVSWTVAHGSTVNKNDPIANVEGEKTTFELIAPASGIIHHLVQPGQTIKVSKVIGYVTQPGESVPALEEEDEDDSARQEEPPAVQEIKEGEILAAPSTRRLAKEKGVDLSQVTGSAKNGRITDLDVLNWLEKHKGTSTPDNSIAKNIIPLAGMRGAIARGMVSSLQTSAQLTSMVEMDATEVVSWYRQNKETQKVTFTDLFIKATALALRQHRNLNAHIVDNEIHLLEDINIGMAVAVKAGLIVPVVRYADKLSLAEISQQVRHLGQNAREGKLTAEEMTEGTFTITNMGMYGIDFGTPIINQPQVAILLIGRIVEKPAVWQGSIVPRAMVWTSLTHDHRATDGVPPAKFLQTLADLLLTPNGWAV